MTDNQRAQLNRFLAERVMGWVEGELNGNQVYRSYEGCEMFVNAWNPCELLRYCEPLLDKIERDKWYWSLDNADDGGYGCHAWNHEDYGYGWSKSSRTEALCLAIARLYGWKEEG